MDAPSWNGEPGAMPYDPDRDPDPDEEARTTCQRCGGDGGYHDCGEDTCCCDLASRWDQPDPKWVICPACRGTGLE